MGEHAIEDARDPATLRSFMQRLIDEVRVLEHMLERGQLERGVTRIGAEQELVLVDAGQRPAPRALELLDKIDDPHFTTELARFNIEINLDPLELGDDCFSRLHADLETLLAKARRGAQELGFDVMMTGILPTLEKDDMGLDNMTPMPRYAALNRITRAARGRDFRFHITGADELSVRHESVMLEACNTSFQVHLQVAPDRFAHLYNLAQAAAGPALAA
ncbi:MAG: signal transduction protein, partial [Acidobacteriota bacterium]